MQTLWMNGKGWDGCADASIYKQTSYHLAPMFNSQKCSHIYSICQQGGLGKGQLFLGSVGSLHSAILKGNRIRAVVTVLQEKEYLQHHVAWRVEKQGLRHLWIEARDSEEVPLYGHFASASAFIYQQLEEGNVLVHCQMGKSRSASIVIAFLIQQLRISAEQAYTLVQTKRPIVDPNAGFRRQISEYQRQLLGWSGQQKEEQRDREGNLKEQV